MTAASLALPCAPAPPPPPAAFGGPPLYDAPIPIARPWLPEASGLLEQYRALLETGRLTNGAAVRSFEAAAARYLGIAECVAVSSCTSGLILVERALGLKGRVIVPSFTFFATAHSLLWNGLEPVLADCDPFTWNLDLNSVRRVLEKVPGISGILAVHIFGNPAPAGDLEALARDAGVRLIFDAAHAFGARRDGRLAGGWGDAEVFSLSPTKPLVAAEGGLVTTRNPDLARALRAARNYGDDGTYDPSVLGLNARMTEFQALLGQLCLPLLEPHVEHRNRLARRYEACLEGQPGVTLQRVRPEDRSTRKDFSLVVDEAAFRVSRNFLHAALEKENIQVRRYFHPPLHRQRLYRRFHRPDAEPLEVTDRVSRGVLSLPIHPWLSEEDAERIARRLLQIRDWSSGHGFQHRAAQRKATLDPVVEPVALRPYYPQPADALVAARAES
jgi:dTDP-4-amino-4,6-dideoxygalactose transaminase